MACVSAGAGGGRIALKKIGNNIWQTSFNGNSTSGYTVNRGHDANGNLRYFVSRGSYRSKGYKTLSEARSEALSKYKKALNR